ncbi:MAG: choice-of-anchor B family protein [Planctomycetota bacterium]
MLRASLSCCVGLAALTVSSFDAAAQSRNASLMSRFDPPGRTFNDVWGYVSPTGKEYALLGATVGTYVVDCSDPSNPIERGFFPGPNSTWRDIRTYREYAYVVTEGGGGAQIIDLSDPDNPVLVQTWGASIFRNAHNVALDTQTGTLYPCGTSAGVVIADLSADPANPTLITTWSNSYVHDLHVQDGYAHLGEISNSRYEILDVSDLSSIQGLGTTRVSSAHNVWPTRDNTLAVVTSESFNPGVTIVDITNKRLPNNVGNYRTGGSGASAHNAFIRDRVMHVSYYSEGYRAVDLTNASNPVEVGYYDTTSATSGFSGAWGCYPFQPSGAIYASDFQNGLLVISSKAAGCLFGDGTAGAGGEAPEVHTYGSGWVGNSRFAVQIEGAAPSAQVALVLGTAQGSASVLGTEVLVDLAQPFALLSGQTDAFGNATFAMPLSDGSPIGTVYAQFFVRDAQGPNGLAASRGMKFDTFAL